MTTSAAKKCPNCGLLNPPTGLHCDCGYDLYQQRLPGALLPEHLVPASLDKRFVAKLIDSMVTCTILIFWVALLGEGVSSLLGFLFFIAYTPTCEWLTQQTLGKRIMGMRVVNSFGDPPSFWPIVGRNLARQIPFDLLSGLGGEPVFWHDSLSGTTVIDIKKSQLCSAQSAPPPMQLRPLMEQVTTPLANATGIDLDSSF